MRSRLVLRNLSSSLLHIFLLTYLVPGYAISPEIGGNSVRVVFRMYNGRSFWRHFGFAGISPGKASSGRVGVGVSVEF